MSFSPIGDELEKELAQSDGGVGNSHDEPAPAPKGRGGRRGSGRGKGGPAGPGGRGGQNGQAPRGKSGQGGGRGSQRRRKGGSGGGSGAGAGKNGPTAAAEKLSSPQNPQIKALVKLRHRRTRDQLGLTVIEEPLVLRRAWETGYPLQAVYYSPDQMSPAAKELLEDLRAAGQAGQIELKMVEMHSSLLRKAAYRDQPEGILAVAPQRRATLDDLKLHENSLLMVLENVEKPGNLGAVLRIADGVGADAVIVTGEGTDLFNPNVLRASRGAFFSVPSVQCHVGECRDFLHERGMRVMATTPSATDSYTKADLTGAVAVVLGCEHEGLSEAWLKDEGSVAVRIPMRGRGDSLNVSTAAAVILYEAMRQRAMTATA